MVYDVVESEFGVEVGVEEEEGFVNEVVGLVEKVYWI